ncbi:MAG: YdcF family protein [Parvularculaceae bacterium]
MKRAFVIALAAALAWTAGLIAFADMASAPVRGAPQKAEAIAVLTGGSARIDAGVSLLATGAGGRLLISGVTPQTSRARIADLWGGDAKMFDCCVDLGVEARTTAGNAEEIRAWMASHAFTTVILVTSDYHMPRALFEARRRARGATITPHPVRSGGFADDRRPRRLADWRIVATEYTKYVAARFGALFGVASA